MSADDKPTDPLLPRLHVRNSDLDISKALKKSQEVEASMISNTADFDTKKSGLHHISQILHKSQSWGEWFDELFAVCLVLLTFLAILFSVLRWVWRILDGAMQRSAPSAIGLVKLSGDLVTAVAALAIVFLWVTICYKWTPVHGLWQGKHFQMFTKTLMPGGFAPRPTALSLGTLMFVTSTLIKEDLKAGSDLNEHTIGGYEGCRAVEMSRIGAEKQWLNRLHRHGPANMGFTCFHVNQSDALGYVFTAGPFTWDDYGHLPGNVSLLVHPKHQEPVDRSSNNFVNNMKNAIVMFFSRYFANPSQYEDTSQWECKYQCVKWESVGIKSLLSSVSILLVGCAAITKFTDLLSSNFGGRMLGGQFISADTESKDMFNILKNTLKKKWIPRSRLFCFLVVFSTLFVPMQVIAPKICLDGYYSVDYWVSGVFISSLFIALILRRWNPYLNAPMVYTRKLWEEGEDMFVKIDPPHDTEYVKIDLYQWFHLNAKQRNRHLFKYARRVSADDVDSEIKRQKKMMSMLLNVDWSGQIHEDPTTVTESSEERDQIRGFFVLQKPETSHKWGDQMGYYEHNLKDTKIEYVNNSHKWKLTTASSKKVYWSEDTEHGNQPPKGKWTADDKTYINLSLTQAEGFKDKRLKNDIETMAWKPIESREKDDGKLIVPKHFRMKEGSKEGDPVVVHYDPALDDEGSPLLVMSLNTFEVVEWIEGSALDKTPDNDVPDRAEGNEAQSRFLVRKVTTSIQKGTVGVVIAKKSKEEALINWCVGERRFFPPLHGTTPKDPVMNRLKAIAKLTNLMEVGQTWRHVRADLEKISKAQQAEDLEMAMVPEPDREQRTPYCYRSAAELADTIGKQEDAAGPADTA